MDTLWLRLPAAVLCGVAALMSLPLFLRFKWPSPALWFIKLYASALSPFFLLAGIISIVAGLTMHSVILTAAAFCVVVAFTFHIYKVTRRPAGSKGFKNTLDHDSSVSTLKGRYALKRRYAFILPVVPEPRLIQDLTYAKASGTDRPLLCDIWQPGEGVDRSGVAFIYLHGGAWFLLDKDAGTRTFFKHLAAQGHVIMDVAYRLSPETDFMGMVHDAKRAVNWMKEHGAGFGVNPDKVVIGGGSSGAHVALLTAYTSHDLRFTPAELVNKDLDVCAVISMYGPADLEAMYYHTNQHITTVANNLSKKEKPSQMPQWIIKKMGKEYHRLGFDKGFENGSSFVLLLGCHPSECPDKYRLYSPISHVHEHCPPTLLIHGGDDIMAPVKSARELYRKLREKNADVILHILPQTDHAFDLQLPKFSPSAHNAIYDVQCFLSVHQATMHKELSTVS